MNKPKNSFYLPISYESDPLFSPEILETNLLFISTVIPLQAVYGIHRLETNF